ncbi:hypothetical protein I6E26_03760 [Anaerovibrio lipolyticus]|uniref:hypothetical protein n=1 Tax=Anaerovibrio lipolyticus TaxID=82374 RepID=UPI001F27F1BD|nr:hypothetical protein [Anaerovibrio lipolyticus]MCF2600673.1 hypothetical protein [Anaerovibrio lipolyticus]
MKAMYRPVATNGMVEDGFFIDSLPKLDASGTDSFKAMEMRVAGLVGMLAMGALIIAM